LIGYSGFSWQLGVRASCSVDESLLQTEAQLNNNMRLP